MTVVGFCVASACTDVLQFDLEDRIWHGVAVPVVAAPASAVPCCWGLSWARWVTVAANGGGLPETTGDATESYYNGIRAGPLNVAMAWQAACHSWCSYAKRPRKQCQRPRDDIRRRRKRRRIPPSQASGTQRGVSSRTAPLPFLTLHPRAVWGTASARPAPMVDGHHDYAVHHRPHHGRQCSRGLPAGKDLDIDDDAVFRPER